MKQTVLLALLGLTTVEALTVQKEAQALQVATDAKVASTQAEKAKDSDSDSDSDSSSGSNDEDSKKDEKTAKEAVQKVQSTAQQESKSNAA